MVEAQRDSGFNKHTNKNSSENSQVLDSKSIKKGATVQRELVKGLQKAWGAIDFKRQQESPGLQK